MRAASGARTGTAAAVSAVGLNRRVTVHDVARRLPGIGVLRDHCRGLAMLEAVLSPEWADRYYSFDCGWSDDEEMASMRDGQGDDWFLVFSPDGAYLRGFAHESPMSPYARHTEPRPWPGVLDEVPEVFRRHLEEPAFADEDGRPLATACLWRKTGDTAWRAGEVDFPAEADEPADGADDLFELLVDRSAEAYRDWAEEYYEVRVDLEAVRHVLALRPLTDEVVAALNADVTLPGLAGEIAEIGYPVG